MHKAAYIGNRLPKMGNFITIIRRSVLTDEYLKGMDLNERQITAVKHIDRYGKITRAEYEKLCLVSARTANRELGVLFKKNLVEKKGKGPETYYILARFGKRKEKVIKSISKTKNLQVINHETQK